MRELEEADSCIARRGQEHAEAVCPRSSQCHCARPIGHPIPVPVHDPREPHQLIAMDHDTVEQFRRTLLGRRVSLLRLWRQARADWEDDAAGETGASSLDSIDETGRRALARIQSCLVRIARGSYAECAACHGDIDEARLRAVPDTDRCGGCATEN